jgi:hypothetical protein
MAPNIYDWGFREYLQDSPSCLKRGIVHIIIHTQIYRRDFFSYRCVLNRS